MNREEFPIQIDDEKSIRVDRFVASLGLFTRSQISQRSVTVKGPEGQVLKLSKRLKNGDQVIVEWDDPPSSEIVPESMDLDVIYEDDHCIVVNKMQGVVVHPAYGHIHGTLVQGLLYRYAEMEKAFGGDRVRPGIVHRLDKDTSGLLIAARDVETLAALSRQFSDRSVKKTYLAIVRGKLPKSEGEIDLSIGRDPRDRKKFAVNVRNSRSALTRYRVLAVSGGYSLVRLRILTGRTHQIRVHLLSQGCPILGDPIYSRRDTGFPDSTLMLHSWKLSIQIPGVGKKGFLAPLPERFTEILSELDIDLFSSEV
jgi:23S rRNA pseudouridine1911/1915/1917 synthase